MYTCVSSDRECGPFQVVPSAVSFWQKALKVRRMDATVRLNRKCENNQYFLSPGDPTQFCKNRCVETKCGEFVVPEEHLTACSTCNSRGRECGLKEEEGAGVDDVDFILYVSARDTKQCGGKIGEGLRGGPASCNNGVWRHVSLWKQQRHI